MKQGPIAGTTGLIAACVIAFGATAMAEDDKVFNGSMCTFSEPDHSGGQERSNIKLWNQSGQLENISCPVKRDLATGVIFEAYIIGSAQIDEDSCKFWSRDDDFSYEVWTHNNVVSVAPGYNKTEWANGSTYLDPSDFASLQITCDLPDNTGVYSYWIIEE